MTTNEQIKPATKAQIDALIDLCKQYELYNAAGFLQLASNELDEAANGKPVCICLEIIGDNGDCPVHGNGFESHGAFSDSDIQDDYRDRNELYMIAMGA